MPSLVVIQRNKAYNFTHTLFYMNLGVRVDIENWKLPILWQKPVKGIAKISQNSQFCGLPNSCKIGYIQIVEYTLNRWSQARNAWRAAIWSDSVPRAQYQAAIPSSTLLSKQFCTKLGCSLIFFKKSLRCLLKATNSWN